MVLLDTGPFQDGGEASSGRRGATVSHFAPLRSPQIGVAMIVVVVVELEHEDGMRVVVMVVE